MKKMNSRVGLAAGMATAIALTAAAMISSTAHADAVVGEPAPDFSVVDTSGQVRTLDEFEGKRVILEWTNHKCPFVVKHYSDPRNNMQTLQSSLTEDGDTVWLSVISSAPGKQGHLDAEGADAQTEKRGAAPTAVLLDETGVMGKAYNAKTTPHMYIIDKDEAQTLRYAGAIDSIRSAKPEDIDTAVNFVTSGIANLDADKAPDPAVTQAYGCSVKYAS